MWLWGVVNVAGGSECGSGCSECGLGGSECGVGVVSVG